LPKIGIDTGEGVFDPDSNNGCDHEVACLEHPLHHGEGAFRQESRSADAFIPPAFLDRKGRPRTAPRMVLSIDALGFMPKQPLSQ